MNELLNIEVYNDQTNKVEVKFREMRLVNNATEQYMFINFDEVQTGPINGPAGIKTTPLTIYAVNTTRVPVHRKDATGAIVPVMTEPVGIEGETGYKPAKQATIGEFDLWIGAFKQMFAAPLEKSVLRKKGLLPGEPLMYVMP